MVRLSRLNITGKDSGSSLFFGMESTSHETLQAMLVKPAALPRPTLWDSASLVMEVKNAYSSRR